MSQTSAQNWIIRTWLLGSFWGAVYTFSTLFIADLDPLRSLDLAMKNFLLDHVTRPNHERSAPGLPDPNQVLQDIILVNMDMEVAQSQGLDNPQFYANALQEMSLAKKVLVHIPDEFVTNTNGKQGDKIRQLFQAYLSTFILVINPYFTPLKEEVIPPFYSQFWGPDHSLKNSGKSGLVDFSSPLFPENSNQLNPTIFYISERKLSAFDRPDQRLKSAICLLSEKTDGRPCQTPKSPAKPSGLFKFWGDRHVFGSLSIIDFCQLANPVSTEPAPCRPTPKDREKIKNKTLIVGVLRHGNSQDATLIPSPYGNLSVIEMQANLLASMRLGSLYNEVTIVNQDNSFIIIGAGTFILIVMLSAVPIPDRRKALQVGAACACVCIWGYGGLIFVALATYQHLLPIVLPILTWLLTSTTLLLSLVGWRYLDRSAQQKQRFIEQSTVLSQTRKLLSRIATDIHDKPLQDLKLVMDQLEDLTFDGKVNPDLLCLHHPTRGSISLVEKLSYIGQDIRDHLNDMQTVANKQHTISPELASGLTAGIRQWLDQLQSDAELRLAVHTNLGPLQEPGLDANSWLMRGDLSRFFSDAGDRTMDWIDAREDIFRFFKEAITNVMKHAQPLNGDATQVVITLNQVGRDCTLVVENDGSPLSAPNPKGTGTKTMETIATGLPAGAWQRDFLATGGVRVSLHWKMPAVAVQKKAKI